MTAKVRIEITKRITFKSGHVFERGSILEVTPMPYDAWDKTTDRMVARQGYLADGPEGPSTGFMIPASRAKVLS